MSDSVAEKPAEEAPVATPAAKKRRRVLAERALSTVILWGVTVGVFVSMQPWAYFGLMFFLATMGAWEFRKMLDGQPGKGCRTIGFLTGVVMLVMLWATILRETAVRPGFDWEMTGLLIAVAGGFCWRFRVGIAGRESINAVSDGIMTYVYVPVLFGSFAMRLAFAPVSDAAVPGAWLVLLMLTIAKFTDMGAYLVGSMIGKHKMAPKLSPGKTWEGFGGALLFALIAGYGIWFLAGDALAWLPVGHVAPLSLIAGVFAVAGDLSESVLKRSLGVKDSGKLMPGIGGVLDLVDSMCFAAPVVYLYLVATGLIQ